LYYPLTHYKWKENQYASTEKFKGSLTKFHVDEDVISQINEGFEDVTDKAPKKKKAAYFKHAVDVMNEQMDLDKFQEIFEWNSCCKSGAREKASKAFAKENANATLDEKLEKIKSVPYMGQPVYNHNGTITTYAVSWFDGEKYQCACSNFSHLKRDYDISKNYCFCCAGHFKYHYEIMLGLKLKTLEIVSSPLDSNGKNPCVIRYQIL